MELARALSLPKLGVMLHLILGLTQGFPLIVLLLIRWKPYPNYFSKPVFPHSKSFASLASAQK